MSAAVAAAVVGAVVGVAGLAMSISSANAQADAAKKAQRAQSRAASAQAQQERIKQIREARIRRGQMMAGAAGQGAGLASSGVAGGSSSISSQMGNNIGNINVQEGFAQIASRYNQQAADAGAKMQQWQGISSLGMSMFSWGANRAGTGTSTDMLGNLGTNMVKVFGKGQ